MQQNTKSGTDKFLRDVQERDGPLLSCLLRDPEAQILARAMTVLEATCERWRSLLSCYQVAWGGMQGTEDIIII